MKRSFTRIFCTLLSCLLLVGFLAGGVVAMAEDAATGQCGQNLTWRYDPETGVLTIEGEGNMWDYDSLKLMPWFQYADNIKKIVLSNGVTSIGKNAFACCAVEEVEFPETLKTIGARAFYQCEKLTKVDLSKTQVTTVAQEAFSGCKDLKTEEVKLPETAKSVAGNAFEKAVVKPVQAPAPVQTPVETPQEPAASNTWEENFPDGSKLVLTRQADGTVAVVSYLKDGSVDYRSVRTYGADGKVHEEYKFTDGTFLVEDRIEDKDGNPLSGTYLEYDEKNVLKVKSTYVTEGNVTKSKTFDPKGDRLLNETTTTVLDDGSYTRDFVGYDNGKVWITRNGQYDKDNQLIKETYIQTSGDKYTSRKREGTRVPGENGTVIDTYKTTETTIFPIGTTGEMGKTTKYLSATATVDSAGRVIFAEGEHRNEKGEVTDKYKETTKYNEDGSSVSTYTTLGADNKPTYIQETSIAKDGSSVSTLTSLGADGKITSTSESAYDKNGNWLKNTDIYYDATDSTGRPCVETTTTEKGGVITTKRDFTDERGGTEESKEVRKNGILVSRDSVIKDSEGNQISTKQESMKQISDDQFEYTSTEKTSEGKVIVTKEDRVNLGSMAISKTVTTTDENAKTETVEKYDYNYYNGSLTLTLTEKKETNTETGDYSVTTMNPEDGTPKTEYFDKDGNPKPSENAANEPASLEALEEEKPVDDGFLLEDRDLDDEISDGMDTEAGAPVVDNSDEVKPDEKLNHDDDISDGMDTEEGTPVVDNSDEVKPDEKLNHDDDISDLMDTEEGAPVAGGTDEVKPDEKLNHDDDISNGMDTEEGAPVAGGTDEVKPDEKLNHDDDISDGMDTEEGAPVAGGTDENNADVKSTDKVNADEKNTVEKNTVAVNPGAESTGKESTGKESTGKETTGKENPSAESSTTQVTPAPAADTQAAPAPAASTQPGAATTQVTSSQEESGKKDTDKKKDKKKNKKKNGEEDLLDEETTTEAVAKEEIA